MELLCQKRYPGKCQRFGTHWNIFQLHLKNTTEGPNPQVVRELGAVVTTVGLSEQSKIVVLVVGELGIECLQKLPDVWCGGDSRGHGVGAVTEAGADRLVNVEHVGEIIPTVRVQHGSRSRDVVEGAWAILLEEANHTAATRTTVEP